jgi:PEP-CTERM/exosortase A-associated glycosyltransferase
MTDVLHVLDHSLPEQSGYAFRSHSILRELAGRGLDLAVLTGPKHGGITSDAEDIDGICYRRTALPPGATTSGVAGQIRTVRSLRARIARQLREQPANVIHAHSPCLNGLAALGHGTPLVYEMRSSWEDAAVSSGTTTAGSLRYRFSKMLETFVARRADEIVVICEGLKRELMSRGIADSKITVVPNALPAEMFDLPPPEQIAAIRARYGLERAKVIGFFGSFFEWEGIDSLVAALPAVLAVVPSARLLLAGGGRQETELRRLVEQRGLLDQVIFAGRIAHDEVRAFYGAADVVAYPRIPERLTEMVTPLKPLEAMAQGTPVVASDVGGHRELLADGKTGFLFTAGDIDALAAKLLHVLHGTATVPQVVAAARQVVERERRWSVVVERYVPVYARLGAGGRRAQRAAGAQQ